MEYEKSYDIVLENDNTLKTFFERFYVIPKEGEEWGEDERAFLEKHKLSLIKEEHRNGKNGYIVFRKCKVNKQIAQDIKNAPGTQKEKAERYGLSIGTINKIMNDKY